ncbi:caffeine induced death protein Cid2 [Schizosaccharomyces cryophilus OY26]|uniref:Caffeine induced death protein Cid2 n=1 Tax=Schizosaccharomyces cryophilus (strain OY26 / ATCC MYA-4695 / CBS 11777 / NBRC 106824 / NRRL Y48691) TaxID=653667 RepID=S9XE90_SCHCR|nr:caffeine induced death protein Cid2 [Schizosaccharomyces cryophilus OY26]EPY52096.1 caffeine induced death protein Cid2 [Schizosaccharomyces cryophilus OY26]
MSEEKRGLCMNIRYLKNVLRKTRKMDDTIQLSLNSAKWESPGQARESQEQRCYRVKRELFQSWLNRDQFLKECISIAEEEIHKDTPSLKSSTFSPEEPLVSERLDPYAKTQEIRTSPPEEVRMALQSEQAVENIIRGQTWETLKNACPGMFGNWEADYSKNIFQ